MELNNSVCPRRPPVIRDDKYALTYVGGVIVAAAITAHRRQLTDVT
ncbi:MAG: hypothetical protein ACLP75_07560 [Mycobacterium sp.]